MLSGQAAGLSIKMTGVQVYHAQWSGCRTVNQDDRGGGFKSTMLSGQAAGLSIKMTWVQVYHAQWSGCRTVNQDDRGSSLPCSVVRLQDGQSR